MVFHVIAKPPPFDDLFQCALNLQLILDSPMNSLCYYASYLLRAEMQLSTARLCTVRLSFPRPVRLSYDMPVLFPNFTHTYQMCLL